MQSLEHTTKTVGRGQRLPMNSLWPSTARTRARKCRTSVETARRFIKRSPGMVGSYLSATSKKTQKGDTWRFLNGCSI